MLTSRSDCKWRVGLLVILALILFAATAQAVESCPPANLGDIPKQVSEMVARNGREARFETTFAQGNKACLVWLNESYQLASQYTFFASVGSGDGKSVPAPVLGVQMNENGKTLLVVKTPDVGWFWPTCTFYLLGCPSDAKNPKISAEFSATVSKRTTAAFFSILTALAVYGGIILSWRKSHGVWTFNPMRLTVGLIGRSSIANLQTLFFTIIVVGLIAYGVLRRGELSDLSSTVVGLLGIVAGGTAMARWTAKLREQISPVNIRYLKDLGWLPKPGSAMAASNALLSRDGELDVTRIQALAFSLVVGGR